MVVPISLKPGAEQSNAPPPRGFLLAARVNGRTFHQEVSTLLPGWSAKQPQLLVGTSPRPPDAALTELGVRANARQPIYVFVHNPGEERRKVAVRLKAEGHPADGLTSEPLDLSAQEK